MCGKDDRTELSAVVFGLAPRMCDGAAQVNTEQNRSATTMPYDTIAAGAKNNATRKGKLWQPCLILLVKSVKWFFANLFCNIMKTSSSPSSIIITTNIIYHQSSINMFIIIIVPIVIIILIIITVVLVVVISIAPQDSELDNLCLKWRDLDPSQELSSLQVRGARELESLRALEILVELSRAYSPLECFMLRMGSPSQPSLYQAPHPRETTQSLWLSVIISDH